MGSIDAVLITIISAVICICLPRFLSWILSLKTKLFPSPEMDFRLNKKK